MKPKRPHSVDEHTSWSLTLHHSRTIDVLLESLTERLKSATDTWRSIKRLDAADGFDVIATALEFLPPAHRNAHQGMNCYVLLMAFARQMEDAKELLEQVTDNDWEDLFQPFTQTTNPTKES